MLLAPLLARPLPRYHAAVALALLLYLAGCYVPVDFRAEVNISRSGYYDMRFDGEVAWMPLHDRLRKGELTPAEEREDVHLILTDLKRDSSTKSVTYGRGGRFKVSWRDSGDLLQNKMVTFVRRNESILSVKYVKETGQIVVNGPSLSKSQADRVIRSGITPSGELTVITDGRVTQHNADQVSNHGVRGTSYTWRIRSPLGPSPHLVIAMR